MARTFTNNVLLVEGAKDLTKEFQRLQKSLGPEVLNSMLFKSALPTVKLMKQKVPVKSGETKSAIGRRRIPVSQRTGREAAGVFAGVTNRKKGWKAHFIEFGTSGLISKGRRRGTRYRADQPPRPFIRPAWDQDKRNITPRVGELVKAKIGLK